MSAASQSSLFQEAGWALGGTWRLLMGREEARAYFDFSQRGLAGSFIPLVLATVGLVGFIGLGAAETGVSAATQIFILGAIAVLRFSALRVALPRFGALHAFRPSMVASNWAPAILFAAIVPVTFAAAFIGALVLGPASGSTLVSFVLMLWAAMALGLVVIEVNILRIVARLRAPEIVLALAAQLFAILFGLYLISRLFQG